MKSILLSLLSLFAISTFAFNQTFSITNQTSIGTYQHENIVGRSIQLSDGNYLSQSGTEGGIDGDKTIPSFGGSDIWLFKTDVNNQLIWQKAIGGPSMQLPMDILEDQFQNIYCAGIIDSTFWGSPILNTNGYSDYYLAKLSSAGSLIWQKNFGGDLNENVEHILSLGDSMIILSGHSFSGISLDKSSPNYGFSDAWVVALDTSGNLLWEKSFGGSDFEYVSGVIYNPVHNSLIVVISSSSPISGNKTVDTFGGSDIWIVELDLDGSILQQKSFGGISTEFAKDVTLNFSNDGFFVLGWSSSAPSGNKTAMNYGNNDVWLFEIDANLNMVQDQSFGGSNIDTGIDLIKRNNGQLLVFGGSLSGISGVKTEASYGGGDNWILGLDENFILHWQKAVGGSTNDTPLSIFETGHNQFKVFSSSESPVSGNKTVASKGNRDVWIYDLSTTASITSIVDSPISYYPNPVSNMLFFNNIEEHTEVLVFNQMGQLVIKTEVLNSSIETNSLSSGIYMIQVETEFGTFMEKVIKE